jgi:hypothetical protein
MPVIAGSDRRALTGFRDLARFIWRNPHSVEKSRIFRTSGHPSGPTGSQVTRGSRDGIILDGRITNRHNAPITCVTIERHLDAIAYYAYINYTLHLY